MPGPAPDPRRFRVRGRAAEWSGRRRRCGRRVVLEVGRGCEGRSGLGSCGVAHWSHLDDEEGMLVVRIRLSIPPLATQWCFVGYQEDVKCDLDCH